MRNHLSSREFVTALDDALDERQSRHLERCESCRDRLHELRETVEALGASADVPEPSPLFWQQLEERVRRATANVSEPSRASSWWSWRPMVVLAPAAVAVLLVIAVVEDPDPYLPAVEEGLVEPGVPGLPPPVDMPANTVAQGGSERAWSEIVDLTTSMSPDELQAVAPPARVGTDALIEELTQVQRAELLRLIRAEIEGGR